MDPSAIAAAGVPVLCVDTCSILDIMRDPTRPKQRAHEHRSAIELVSAAEAKKLACLMAEQVELEFADHDQSVQDEAEKNLQKMQAQVERVNSLSAVYGVSAVVDLKHLNDYVARARGVVTRWIAQLDKVVPSAAVHVKAFGRMNAARAPARRGKDSSKDCLVYETYIDAITSLRGAGVRAPIVFLSSNTEEYLTGGSSLKPDIEAEFNALSIQYAPNMAAAKHALGL